MCDLLQSTVASRKPEGVGVLSGRVANEFNAIMEACGKTPCFRYCIAGGDAAIFQTIEGCGG